MYERKIIKQGNSHYISIPKAIIDELNLNTGDKICMAKVKQGLLLNPDKQYMFDLLGYKTIN